MTARNRARPPIMCSTAACACASEKVSIIGRTLARCAKSNASRESDEVPEAHPCTRGRTALGHRAQPRIPAHWPAPNVRVAAPATASAGPGGADHRPAPSSGWVPRPLRRRREGCSLSVCPTRPGVPVTNCADRHGKPWVPLMARQTQRLAFWPLPRPAPARSLLSGDRSSRGRTSRGIRHGSGTTNSAARSRKCRRANIAHW